MNADRALRNAQVALARAVKAADLLDRDAVTPVLRPAEARALLAASQPTTR